MGVGAFLKSGGLGLWDPLPHVRRKFKKRGFWPEGLGPIFFGAEGAEGTFFRFFFHPQNASPKAILGHIWA